MYKCIPASLCTSKFAFNLASALQPCCCPRPAPRPACLSVCVFIRPFVCDLAPAHSQSISSPINSPTCQENRWSPLTEVLLFRSAANNTVLSMHHSGRFTPAFSHQSLLYQRQPRGLIGALRGRIVNVGFVGSCWFPRMSLWEVMT